MLTFDVFWSVLLPAPSPALPEAMAGAPSMEGYLATARATQLVDIVRWLCLKVSLRRLSSRRAGGGRDMWFHHPSQALPLTATVPRLPNGMERKARRAARRPHTPRGAAAAAVGRARPRRRRWGRGCARRPGAPEPTQGGPGRVTLALRRPLAAPRRYLPVRRCYIGCVLPREHF